MKLLNKNPIVTRGSQGIRSSISLAFAREGADVVAGYRASAKRAKEERDEIQSILRRSSWNSL